MAPRLRFSAYGYTPTEYVCIIFVVLFSISSISHLGQAAYYRRWWLLPTVCLAGVFEIVGWGARLWSSQRPFVFTPYEIQIVCTIMGPTPLAAANFIVLGHIINRLGPVYSRLTPKLYTIIFCCCDVVSLVVQGVGGGMAAMAVNKRKSPEKGGNVMLGGIIFQLVTIIVYALCAGEFFLRFLHQRPIQSRVAAGAALPSTKSAPLSPRLKLLIGALAFNTTCLVVRAIYRVIELSDGWSGRIIHTEVYFNVLDGMMIALAIITLNFAHPGFLLKEQVGERHAETEKARDGDSEEG